MDLKIGLKLQDKFKEEQENNVEKGINIYNLKMA